MFCTSRGTKSEEVEISIKYVVALADALQVAVNAVQVPDALFAVGDAGVAGSRGAGTVIDEALVPQLLFPLTL